MMALKFDLLMYVNVVPESTKALYCELEPFIT